MLSLWLSSTALVFSSAPQGEWRAQRLELVKRTIESPRDGRPAVSDRRVLRAMQTVERHLFVPSQWRRWSYEDRPLPIGHEQTISQPYIVAIMTELLELTGDEVVL